MMKTKAPSSTCQFCAGGQGAYLDALAKKEAETLAPLEAKLKTATDPAVKTGIEDEIRAIRKQFREKRRQADRSLFFGAGAR